MRRCLLEVVLAQVRALIPSLLHGWLQAGVAKQHGVFGNEREKTIPGRFHISHAPITWSHLGHMLHSALYLWPVYLNGKGALNK